MTGRNDFFKLAFIGPGTMGFGMAMRLAAGSEECLVIGRSPEKLRPFSEKGISTSSDPGDAARAEIIFLCLPDAAAVRQVLLSHEAPFLRKGQIIADSSTLDFGEARRLEEELKARGVTYLDIPVSGHRAGALKGELILMAGGEKEAFETLRPFLERMGTPYYMGPSGSGQLAKMINNCILNICAASFCELLPLGVSLGLEAGQLGQVIMEASGSSYAARTLIPKILEGDFTHDFTLKAARKDVDSLSFLLKELKLKLPVFEGMREDYEKALSEGYGGLYKGAMIRPFEEALGVLCRKGEKHAET